MSLNLKEKKTVVADVSKQVSSAQTMIVAEYRGIRVDGMTRLRAKAREQNVYLKVLKNTLARRTVEGTSFSDLSQHMVGPLIYGISEDPIAAAKVLHQFSKEDEHIVIKAGVCNGALMDSVQVGALASIPGREELLSKLLYVMKEPVAGFARTLAALAEKKQESGDGSVGEPV